MADDLFDHPELPCEEVRSSQVLCGWMQTMQTVAGTILTIASLSFIGLGIESPTPEWGTMLSEARPVMRYYPMLAIYPGIAIMLTVMSLTLIGDGFRDALDPRLKN